MPELRKDPIVGRWVIIATERARRPGNFIDPSSFVSSLDHKGSACAFCQPQNQIIYSASKNGAPWDVCVLPFDDSFLNLKQEIEHKRSGLYEIFNGYGVHEIVVESKEHIANMAD